MKSKNITVDADLLEVIHALAERLEHEFGFRPTISQTLRYALVTGFRAVTKTSAS